MSILNKSRSCPILESASDQANEAILDRLLFQLNEEKFNQFLTALEQPNNQNVAKLMAIQTPWEKAVSSTPPQ